MRKTDLLTPPGFQRADYPEEPPIWLQAVIMASVVVEICTALWLLGPA